MSQNHLAAGTDNIAASPNICLETQYCDVNLSQARADCQVCCTNTISVPVSTTRTTSDDLIMVGASVSCIW